MVVTRRLRLRTGGDCDIINITPEVHKELANSGLSSGTVTVFVMGTTVSVAMIEYEAGLLQDMKELWDRLVPRGLPYQHNIRNNDNNAHSHMRAGTQGPSLVVPFVDKALTIGTWQQIALIDFDTRPRTRDLVLQFIGE